MFYDLFCKKVQRVFKELLFLVMPVFSSNFAALKFTLGNKGNTY
ncbi:hypothetical protein FEM08_05970 [Flavobacterium gilvum]|nr:hypothetical protein FEM08_05970 [Flavobacterium gilvum]